jgi:hypothetical protein
VFISNEVGENKKNITPPPSACVRESELIRNEVGELSPSSETEDVPPLSPPSSVLEYTLFPRAPADTRRYQKFLYTLLALGFFLTPMRKEGY